MVSEVHPMQQALNALPKGAIWEPGERDYTPMDVNTFRHREMIKDRFSWAIPNEEALDAIAAVGPIVEIGAGTGYWAWLLQKRGVDVVAYDATPPHFGCVNHWHRTSESTFTDVLTGGPQDVVPPANRSMTWKCVIVERVSMSPTADGRSCSKRRGRLFASRRLLRKSATGTRRHSEHHHRHPWPPVTCTPGAWGRCSRAWGMPRAGQCVWRSWISGGMR